MAEEWIDNGTCGTLEIACLEAKAQAESLGETTYVVAVGSGFDWQCTPTEHAIEVYRQGGPGGH